jgi:hypothetical protein
MKFEDIPDHIQLSHLRDMGEWVSVGYKFDGLPKVLEIPKDEKDSCWAMFEGKVTPWRAFLVAIDNEQSQWNKRQAQRQLEPTIDLFKQLGEYFKP